jgi:hypothetical protein
MAPTVPSRSGPSKVVALLNGRAIASSAACIPGAVATARWRAHWQTGAVPPLVAVWVCSAACACSCGSPSQRKSVRKRVIRAVALNAAAGRPVPQSPPRGGWRTARPGDEFASPEDLRALHAGNAAEHETRTYRPLPLPRRNRRYSTRGRDLAQLRAGAYLEHRLSEYRAHST